MIHEIFIKKIDRYSKNAKGIPYMGKYGPYQVVKISADNGKYYSGFSDKINESWQPSMAVSIEVEEKEFNGKTYLNFRTLKPADEKDVIIKGLEMKVAQLEKELAKYKQEQPEEVLEENDGLPF